MEKIKNSYKNILICVILQSRSKKRGEYMIDKEKICMMTRIALIKEREKRNALEICGYRKKDYVSFQVIKVWLCSTAAYLLMLATLLVYEAGKEPALVLSGQVIKKSIVIAVVLYLWLEAVLIITAKRCAAKRYRRSAATVRILRQYLMGLQDYYKERKQINDSSAGTSAKSK